MIRDHNKYIVISVKDGYNYLTAEQTKQLSFMLNIITMGRLKDGKSTRYLVLKEGTPEYEPAWKMLEERLDSENPIYS